VLLTVDSCQFSGPTRSSLPDGNLRIPDGIYTLFNCWDK
jgi:hypothetical protein